VTRAGKSVLHLFLRVHNDHDDDGTVGNNSGCQREKEKAGFVCQVKEEDSSHRIGGNDRANLTNAACQEVGGGKEVAWWVQYRAPCHAVYRLNECTPHGSS